MHPLKSRRRRQLIQLATSSAFLVTYGLIAFAMTRQMSPWAPSADRGQLESTRDAQQLANLINAALGVVGFMAQFGTLALGHRRWALLSVPTWAVGSSVAGLLGVPLWRGATALGLQILEDPSVTVLLGVGAVATAIVVIVVFELLRQLALYMRR